MHKYFLLSFCFIFFFLCIYFNKSIWKGYFLFHHIIFLLYHIILSAWILFLILKHWINYKQFLIDLQLMWKHFELGNLYSNISLSVTKTSENSSQNMKLIKFVFVWRSTSLMGFCAIKHYTTNQLINTEAITYF